MHQVVVVVREVIQVGHRIRVRCVGRWRWVVMVVPLVGRVWMVVEGQRVRWLAAVRMVSAKVGRRRRRTNEHRCCGSDIGRGREGGRRNRTRRRHDRINAQRRRVALQRVAVVAAGLVVVVST